MRFIKSFGVNEISLLQYYTKNDLFNFDRFSIELLLARGSNFHFPSFLYISSRVKLHLVFSSRMYNEIGGAL